LIGGAMGRQKRGFFSGMAVLSLAGCVPPPQGGPTDANGNSLTNLSTPSPARPQVIISENGAKLTVNETMNSIGGLRLRLGFFHDAQNPDCTLNHGIQIVVKPVTQPQHGTLTITSGVDYPSYPTNAPQFKCVSNPIFGQDVYFNPANGYAGTDMLAYVLYDSLGKEILTNVAINITP